MQIFFLFSPFLTLMAPTNKKYYRAKAFIFDLDGTLVDTVPVAKRLWHQFAADHGLDEDKV